MIIHHALKRAQFAKVKLEKVFVMPLFTFLPLFYNSSSFQNVIFMANVAETSRREISLYLVLEIMVIFLEKQLTHLQSSLIGEIYALTGRLLTGNIKNSICNGSVADLLQIQQKKNQLNEVPQVLSYSRLFHTQVRQVSSLQSCQL